MTKLFIIIPVLAFIVGSAVGYLLGRYQASLLDKIQTLEAGQDVEAPPAPTVILGSYRPPSEVSTAPDERPAGLVETKTPQRIEWEQEQAIEKEGRGY